MICKRQDIETHVNEKWKKKMARLQADMTKVKTQMDELNLKNVAFREKLSNASAQRDQVCGMRLTLLIACGWLTLNELLTCCA